MRVYVLCIEFSKFLHVNPSPVLSVMFFIRVVREFVLSLNRDPSCSIEKLSMVKSFCILYTLHFATIVYSKKYSLYISLLFFATSTLALQ